MLIDHICVDTGNTLCQFTLTFYGFRIMYNYIDWSTLSCDTTHLPRISVYEREVVRYTQLITAVFLLQKMAFSAIILLEYCGTSFVVSSYQESVKDSLSVN